MGMDYSAVEKRRAKRAVGAYHERLKLMPKARRKANQSKREWRDERIKRRAGVTKAAALTAEQEMAKTKLIVSHGMDKVLAPFGSSRG